MCACLTCRSVSVCVVLAREHSIWIDRSIISPESLYGCRCCRRHRDRCRRRPTARPAGRDNKKHIKIKWDFVSYCTIWYDLIRYENDMIRYRIYTYSILGKVSYDAHNIYFLSVRRCRTYRSTRHKNQNQQPHSQSVVRSPTGSPPPPLGRSRALGSTVPSHNIGSQIYSLHGIQVLAEVGRQVGKSTYRCQPTYP